MNASTSTPAEAPVSTATAVSTPPVELQEALSDFRLAWRSRHASLLGRREVLTGKAKFGIFGDGKEIAQLALARALRPGDFRSGYYRDQTLMMALGLLSVEQFFAQLYADPDLEREPCSAGRSMTAHFSTWMLDESGRFLPQTDRIHSTADVSPTGSQMPRLVGLAYASRLYRELPDLADRTDFSRHGDELAFGTIGNASCAEGMFWESVNAACVLRSPMLLSIWDDGYGISVPNELQVAKGNLSEILAGFRRTAPEQNGLDLYTVPGWDYAALRETYARAAEVVRRDHVPAVVHVVEVTQPQGHSTSGSHERYKNAERLAFEKEKDGLTRMRAWLLEQGAATAGELDQIEEEERIVAREAQRRAWDEFRAPIEAERKTVSALLSELAAATPEGGDAVREISAELGRVQTPQRRDLASAAHAAAVASLGSASPARERLNAWRTDFERTNRATYSSLLLSEGELSPLAVPTVAPSYDREPQVLNGFEVLNQFFRQALERYPELIAMGEDVGQLGDVNQGFLGLQKDFGPLRVSDTGIRETTILGQAIGMAIRGLRPIAEIQYLDYMLYALQIISDDLATLRYRSAGKQKAPVIVRTRGHRLEGIWHSGSPMAGILNLVRGVHVCVPRNMTQAAGMYGTLLRGDDPAIVVEVLNGYRLKEKLPNNLNEMTVPLGVPEVVREGSDLTLVTYGACVRIALDAAEGLAKVGIEVEVIDVQTLLPFDREARISQSIAKTNRVVFLDEDVPGGTTAYLYQQVIEGQRAFDSLELPPRTISAQPHRPAYGSDGDYWSKPSADTVFTVVYEMMREVSPQRFSALG